MVEGGLGVVELFTSTETDEAGQRKIGRVGDGDKGQFRVGFAERGG